MSEWIWLGAQQVLLAFGLVWSLLALGVYLLLLAVEVWRWWRGH